MGKHINTKVKCFGCGENFMTSKLKNEGEFYECSNCGHVHQSDIDEVNSNWIHSYTLEVNNET